MDRYVPVGLLLLSVSVGLLTAAEPPPRLDRDGMPLPSEVFRRFGMKADDRLPSARWPEYRFAADGKTVTRIGGNTAITWETATGKETGRLLPEKLLTAGAPGVPLIADAYPRKLVARSPDGKSVLTYSNPTIQQMRFTLTLTVGGKEWPDNALTQRMVGVLQAAFTPDGRYALAQLDQEHLHIWDVTGDPTSGTVITFATPGPSGFRQVPLMHPAPDSKRVALVEADPKTPALQPGANYRWRLGVYELDTRQRTAGVSGEGVLTAVDWSADTTRIGVAGLRSSEGPGRDTGFAFVTTSDGQHLMPAVELPKAASACALSPDGRTLAVGTGGEVHLYEVRTGKLRHVFKPDAGDVRGLRFHPDDGALVSESADRAVFLWDVRGELAALAAPDATALAELWTDLDAADAGKAFRAIRRLAQHPAAALPFLKGKVVNQKRPSAQEIEDRVGRLTSRLYAEREKAEKELRAMGRIAHPALKAVVAVDSSPELQARAGRLLATTVTPASVRATRLVEAVEWAGTAEAKALLAAWAAEAGPELAVEAADALARWRK